MLPHILCLILIGMERKRIGIFELEIGRFEKFFTSICSSDDWTHSRKVKKNQHLSVSAKKRHMNKEFFKRMSKFLLILRAEF